MDTAALFARYYFHRPEFVDGTTIFHRLCRREIEGPHILEIGAGPSNDTTRFLATLGEVTGVDVSDEVEANDALTTARVYDGDRLPFDAHRFDACVSNYVIEHLPNPSRHFREVARVLRPGGVYVFRTPNQWHYVALGSRLIPRGRHGVVSKRLRGMTDADHEPWPTHYRANTRHALQRLARQSALTLELTMVETEPSYGTASPVLFYPLFWYERAVNRVPGLRGLRANIFGVARHAVTVQDSV